MFCLLVGVVTARLFQPVPRAVSRDAASTASVPPVAKVGAGATFGPSDVRGRGAAQPWTSVATVAMVSFGALLRAPARSTARPPVRAFGFRGTTSPARRGGRPRATALGPEAAEAPRKLCFLFTGMGSHYVGMGASLYESDSVFRGALDRCAAVADPLLRKPLLDVVFDDAELLGRTEFAHPAIAAIEIALTEMWASRGVRPDVVCGHSLGEGPAAVCAGVMTAEDCMKLACERSRMIQDLCRSGSMCAVFAPRDQVDRAIATLPAEDQGKVVVAAVNGPKQTVMAGESDLVEQVSRVIEAKNVMLDAMHAMHSPLLAPILDKLRAHLQDYTFRPPSVDFVSTITGKVQTCFDVDYWIAHNEPLPVMFLDAMETLLHDLDCTAFLEVGPQPVLMKMGQRCVRKVDRPLQWSATFDAALSETLSVEKAFSELQAHLPTAPSTASVAEVLVSA